MEDYARGFDAGWRRGSFDRCNGRDYARLNEPDNDYDNGYDNGYCHGWNSNERRI